MFFLCTRVLCQYSSSVGSLSLSFYQELRVCTQVCVVLHSLGFFVLLCETFIPDHDRITRTAVFSLTFVQLVLAVLPYGDVNMVGSGLGMSMET